MIYVNGHSEEKGYISVFFNLHKWHKQSGGKRVFISSTLPDALQIFKEDRNLPKPTHSRPSTSMPPKLLTLSPSVSHNYRPNNTSIPLSVFKVCRAGKRSVPLFRKLIASVSFNHPRKIFQILYLFLLLYSELLSLQCFSSVSSPPFNLSHPPMLAPSYSLTY